jgi:hypothetical protein
MSAQDFTESCAITSFGAITQLSLIDAGDLLGAHDSQSTRMQLLGGMFRNGLQAAGRIYCSGRETEHPP